MNSTVNPYDISGFNSLNSHTNLQGTIFSVANPSPRTVPLPKGSITWEQARLREETVLSILIQPSNDPHTIPVATGYGQIFTSRSNLVEAVKIAPDISEGIPISLLLEIADEAGIDVPASYRIQIEQWISQGKGNQTTKGKVLQFHPSQTEEYSSNNSSVAYEVQSQGSPVAQEDQIQELTAMVDNSGNKGKIILGAAVAIVIVGVIYLSNKPQKKTKSNKVKAEKTTTK